MKASGATSMTLRLIILSTILDIESCRECVIERAVR